MGDSLAVNLVRYHPESAAGLLEELEPLEAVAAVGEWPADVAGKVLERMLPHHAGHLLAALGAEACSELLAGMQPRAAVRVLQQLEESERARLLDGLDEELAAELQVLAAWAPETAGGIMDTRVATLRDHMTVQHAIETIRRTPPQSLHYLYVVDAERRLAGVLVMRDMLLAEPHTRVRDIMRTELTTLPVTMPREAIAETFDAFGYAVLPVVDDDHRLVGVVRHDAVIEAARDEAYEDMAVMVGAGAGERALDPVRLVVQRRLPWLLVNLGTAFLASVVVGFFEPVIAAVSALAVLLPVVAGQSGNTGAQTMAVVMRGLVMDEIRPGVRWRVLRKEFLAGMVNGVAVAIVTGLGVFLWDGRWLLAAVIALAMVIAMACSTVAGTLIPVLIAAAGRDPAQSASIFLTTVTDILGFFAFLGLATLAMHWLV